MAEYTLIDPPMMAAAMAGFGLPAPTQVKAEPLGAVNSGYHVWAGGHRFFLRVNEEKQVADARFEAEVALYLHAAHFPVPELRVARDGKPWVEIAGKPAMLFVYTPGEDLPPAQITPEHCRSLGEQVGRLHELAAGFGHHRANPYGRHWVDERLRELVASPPTEPEAAAVLPMLEEEAAFAHRLPGAPRGLAHGDLFPHNVLWIGDRISALIDWEMSASVPFAYDLGVVLNAWCFAGTFRTDRARGLLDGYAARRKIEPETLEALYEWTRFAALRFTVSRLKGFRPTGARAPAASWRDWREFSDRLAVLRGMAEPSFRALIGM